MADPFVCVRQRAGPFVKAFSTDRACFVRRSKDSKGLIRKRAGPAMCRTSVDKLELRLALFGYDGVFYTLTFAPEHLPADLDGVQAVWDAFLKRLARWNRRMGRGGSRTSTSTASRAFTEITATTSTLSCGTATSRRRWCGTYGTGARWTTSRGTASGFWRRRATGIWPDISPRRQPRLGGIYGDAPGNSAA